MKSRNNYSGLEGLDKTAATLAQFHAQQMLTQGLIGKPDLEDTEQEMMMYLLEKVRRREVRGERTSVRFLEQVALTKAGNIVRDLGASKRVDKAQVVSLERGLEVAAIDEAHPDAIDERKFTRVGPERRRSEVERLQLKLDVEKAMQRLPPKTREVCLRLMDGTVGEVAEEMGVKRGTIDSHIKTARKVFLEAGLGGYVPRIRKGRGEKGSANCEEGRMKCGSESGSGTLQEHHRGAETQGGDETGGEEKR